MFLNIMKCLRMFLNIFEGVKCLETFINMWLPLQTIATIMAELP